MKASSPFCEELPNILLKSCHCAAKFAHSLCSIFRMFFFLFSLIGAYDESYITTLFSPGDEGSNFYQIPTIVRANNGSLITSADKRINTIDDLPNRIDVVIKTSHDNGLTWGPTKVIASGNPKGYGDASFVVDRITGNAICLFNGNNGFAQSTPSDPS